MEIKKFPINGLDISYTQTGPSNGKILFAVHGLLSNGRDYDFLAKALSHQGYQTIAVDLPGRGNSSWLNDPKQYTIPFYAEICSKLLKNIAGKKPFDWLGVSLGGIIGMTLHAYKELNINKFIIVDIGPEIPASGLDIVSLMAKQPREYNTKDEAIAFLKKRCEAWGIKQENIWEHLILHNIIQNPSHGWRMHYDPAIGSVLPENNETLKFWEIWENIKQQVLLIRGQKSLLLPSEIAAAMISRYTGETIQFYEIKNCGHVPNLMEDEQINYIMNWLNK